MNAVKGIVKNGHVVLSEPMNWPDGLEVLVEPIAHQNGIGGPEDLQGDDPQTIARWIEEFDAIPPLQMTPQEEADWHRARQEQKEFDIKQFSKRADKLRSMLE